MAGGKKRQSNFELYRILCIVLIVFMHTCGGILEPVPVLSILVHVLGNIGVTGFVLLSGYFGVRFQWNKLVKLDLLMIFGSLFELGLNQTVMGQNVISSPGSIVRCLIPFISHRYWFLSAYFALCILSPFINEYLEKIDKRRHRQLILAAGFLYLLMPTLFFFDQTGDGGKGIMNMILAYVIGRYIGRYHSGERYFPGTLWGMFGGVVLLNCVLNYGLYAVLRIDNAYYARDNSLLIMIQAVLLLFIFMQQGVWENGWVNRIAANVVAVYVLEDPMRTLIMELFPYSDPLHPAMPSLGYMALVAVGVIIVSLVLEMLRRFVFGKLEDQIINHIGECIKSWKK